MGLPASPAQSRAAQQVGMVLKGKWTLDTLIGVGGMAAVYAGTHRNGSRAAIKLLNPEYAAQPEFVARFMREGYVANKINHPASVRVIDDDAEGACAFLVMELLSGHSLERYTRRGGARMLLGQVLNIAEQVLDLLAVAHDHGIVHRDIKPANIQLTAEGTVKVLDFGIARLAERVNDASATQTGSPLGTPSYMPPEQARGRWNLVDPRTDLWSLGATMHALIRGERPRRAETVQEELLLAMTAPLASLGEVMPSTPPAVVAFVDRATAFDMEARWPDAVTMQSELRKLIELVRLPSGLGPNTTPSFAPGASPPTGPEPGSSSGPRMDTARMVPPSRPPGERDPLTLHPTANTSGQTASKSKSRLVMMGAATFVVTLLVGVVLAVRAFSPGATHSPPSLAAATPPTPPQASAAPPPPPVAVAPPVATTAPSGGPPPAPPGSSAAPTSSHHSGTSTHHTSKPAASSPPSIYDERF